MLDSQNLGRLHEGVKRMDFTSIIKKGINKIKKAQSKTKETQSKIAKPNKKK